MSVPLRIQLLGPPRVEVDSRPLVVDTRKAIALLAYLAIVDRPIAREPLAELLWPDADPDDGRGALRRTLSVLRSGLGGDWLAVDRRQVALRRDGVDLDVARFRAGARTDDRSELAAAVAAFRGEFLEGFTLRDSPTFDEWQLLEAEALRGELGSALRRLAGLESAAGRFLEALDAARRLVTMDPLDEAGHRALMELLVRSGDRAAAIRQYRECVRVLDQELGVAPGAETEALYRSVVEAGGSVDPGGVTRRVPGADAGLAAPDAGRASDAGTPDAGTLDGRARDLLAAAAILGDEVDPDLVAVVTERRVDEVETGLQALRQAGWLREPDAAEHRERYRLSASAGEVLSGTGVVRRRELRRRAAAAHAAAGEDARRIGAHGRGAEHFRAALELGHPDAVGLLAAIGDADTLRGRYGEALATYERAAAMAPPEQVPEFEHRLGSLHLRRGSLDLAELHQAAALARVPPGPSALRARVLADRSLIAMRRGDAEAADRAARASLRAARGAADAEAEAQAENLLALVARRRGDLEAARRHLRRSLERAALADRPWAGIAALNGLALLERVAGHLENSLALTEEALRRCEVAGDRHREAALRNHRADVLHALGRHRAAAEEQLRAVTAFAEVGGSSVEPEIWKLVDW